MITRPVTLVLGAGASQPYGFPTGFELRQKILTAHSKTVGGLYGPSVDMSAKLAALEISDFQTEFRHSTIPSIDRFLQIRQRYTDIGKFMIAYCFAQYEEVHPIKNPRVVGGSDWYDYLMNRIIDPETEDDFSKNQLSIITYNYDMSLEQYLVTALESRLGIHVGDALVLLGDTIPIIHIHGTLGNRYDPSLLDHPVAAQAKGLRIISEEISGSPELSKAHECLSKSASILFLGFGYHPVNVERLQIDRYCKNAELSGTVFRYEFSEYQTEVKPLFKGVRFDYPRVRPEAQAIANDWDVLKFLRRSRTHFH